ncbi:hypothetical protein Q7O_001149 [Pectobacterium carotovorum subsp. carotovorum PCCS1]|nr:hypothetical protein [Pectobacterium carotovorum subsp. carotovorum PCCS1]
MNKPRDSTMLGTVAVLRAVSSLLSPSCGHSGDTVVVRGD